MHTFTLKTIEDLEEAYYAWAQGSAIGIDHANSEPHLVHILNSRIYQASMSQTRRRA